MDLLKAVQTDSLEKIKQLAVFKGISIDSEWFDYAVLIAALENKCLDVANFLLDKGYRVNKSSRPSVHDTPLHYAVKLDNIELVNKLLDRDASVAMVNKEGDTPLHLAFMSRNDAIVDAMLSCIELTINVNSKNKRGLSHMHIACIRNNVQAVESFIEKGVNIEDAVDSGSSLWAGYTSLHFAVEFRCFEVIKVLLAAKANVCARDAKNRTPIDLAKAGFDSASVIKFFVSGEQSNTDCSFQTETSEFHIACMRDTPALVEYFIKNNAPVNDPISKSSVFCPLYTPLHFAVESNCKENVELLLKHNAQVERQNTYYMTPLHLALYNEDHNTKNTIVDVLYAKLDPKTTDRTDLNGLTYFHIACTRNDIKTVKKFIDKGEDVNSQILYNLKNFSHYTPLHFAVRYRCFCIAELLIKNGANVNRSDYGIDGTPLHLAFQNGDIEMIELLLKHGARANAIRPFDDKTMLHLFVDQVVIHGHKNFAMQSREYIKRLIKLGCSVNDKDSDGNTPLHVACSKLKDSGKCVDALLEFGADINAENDENCTPFENSFSNFSSLNTDCYMTLYHHVQKLKALNIRVNSKNEECCSKMLNEINKSHLDAECFTNKDIALKIRQRLNEIQKMKDTRIDKTTTLYNVLFDGPQRLSIIAKNITFKKILESKDFNEQYPSYGSMLQLQFQRGRHTEYEVSYKNNNSTLSRETDYHNSSDRNGSKRVRVR